MECRDQIGRDVCATWPRGWVRDSVAGDASAVCGHSASVWQGVRVRVGALVACREDRACGRDVEELGGASFDPIARQGPSATPVTAMGPVQSPRGPRAAAQQRPRITNGPRATAPPPRPAGHATAPTRPYLTASGRNPTLRPAGAGCRQGDVEGVPQVDGRWGGSPPLLIPTPAGATDTTW